MFIVDKRENKARGNRRVQTEPGHEMWARGWGIEQEKKRRDG